MFAVFKIGAGCVSANSLWCHCFLRSACRQGWASARCSCRSLGNAKEQVSAGSALPPGDCEEWTTWRIHGGKNGQASCAQDGTARNGTKGPRFPFPYEKRSSLTNCQKSQRTVLKIMCCGGIIMMLVYRRLPA